MTLTRLAHAKRLVIKVGSALVTNNGTGLDLNAINEWARQIAQLRQAGKEVLLVSSGAIACASAGESRRKPATRREVFFMLRSLSAISGRSGTAFDTAVRTAGPRA